MPDRGEQDRTGTGSHQSRAAGHRLDYKLVISTTKGGGNSFAALYLPGEIHPVASCFHTNRYEAVKRALDQALAKEGITP